VSCLLHTPRAKQRLMTAKGSDLIRELVPASHFQAFIARIVRFTIRIVPHRLQAGINCPLDIVLQLVPDKPDILRSEAHLSDGDLEDAVMRFPEPVVGA